MNPLVSYNSWKGNNMVGGYTTGVMSGFINGPHAQNTYRRGQRQNPYKHLSHSGLLPDSQIIRSAKPKNMVALMQDIPGGYVANSQASFGSAQNCITVDYTPTTNLSENPQTRNGGQYDWTQEYKVLRRTRGPMTILSPKYKTTMAQYLYDKKRTYNQNLSTNDNNAEKCSVVKNRGDGESGGAPMSSNRTDTIVYATIQKSIKSTDNLFVLKNKFGSKLCVNPKYVRMPF